MAKQYELVTVPYYREQAVSYANYWAYRRNPKFYSFDQIGGDCTNFISQALYYANGVMNFTPTYGWYYINLNDRAPAWTGVTFFYQFLVNNQGPGPFGHEIPVNEVLPGDIIQMAIRTPDYGHTAIVTSLISDPPDLDSIWVAAHDNNANCRPLSTYEFTKIRAIRIDGVRYLSVGTDVPPPPPAPLPPEENYPVPIDEENDTDGELPTFAPVG